MCFYLLYKNCVCLKARGYNDVIMMSCTLEKGQKVNIFKCRKQQLRQRECIHLAIAMQTQYMYNLIISHSLHMHVPYRSWVWPGNETTRPYEHATYTVVHSLLTGP